MSKIWIFDLDDTLHNASAHVFPVMNTAMTQYIMTHLNLDERAAYQLRQHYWHIYGATLKGLVRHHGIDPHHFLEHTHTLSNLPDMVQTSKRLRHTLQSLSGQKQVFTNAPLSYALRVLNLLNIRDIFTTIFSVESTQFHPKPSKRGFMRVLKRLKTSPKNCIMVEDNLPALMMAKRMGMETIWVTKQLHKPNYVDHRVSDILALTHINRYN